MQRKKKKKSNVRVSGVTNFQSRGTVFFLSVFIFFLPPLDPIQRDPMLSGLKRVGVNYVITAPLSLGELPKQQVCLLCAQGHPLPANLGTGSCGQHLESKPSRPISTGHAQAAGRFYPQCTTSRLKCSFPPPALLLLAAEPLTVFV